MFNTIVLKPRMSEKAYAQSQLSRTYVFDVPAGVNKHSVAHAVAAQFSVTVTNVNLTNIPGKAKRTVRKGGRPVNGRESDTRKAYVTLAEGNSLPFFAAEDEAAEAKTDGKANKKAAKKAAKESK